MEGLPNEIGKAESMTQAPPCDANQEVLDDPTYKIGYDDKFEADLPLSAAEASVATQDQRVQIAVDVYNSIQQEMAGKKLDRAWLVDEISRRSGLDHANASLIVPYSAELGW